MATSPGEERLCFSNDRFPLTDLVLMQVKSHCGTTSPEEEICVPNLASHSGVLFASISPWRNSWVMYTRQTSFNCYLLHSQKSLVRIMTTQLTKCLIEHRFVSVVHLCSLLLLTRAILLRSQYHYDFCTLTKI